MSKTRPIRMVFQLSEEEYQEVKEKIKKSGLSSQDYLLRTVLKSTVQSSRELKEMLPELKKVGTELNRQDNNLNQIAAFLNQQGYADRDTLTRTLEEVRHATEELKEIWRLLKQYLQNHR